MAEAPAAAPGTLTPDDAVDVLEELLPAQNKSYELGLKLKLQQHVVEAIHDTYSKPRNRLLHVIIAFTNQVEPRPTWRVIVKALRSRVVDLPALANTVEAAHFLVPVRSSVSPASIEDEIENLEDRFLQLTCETRAALSDREQQDKNFLQSFSAFLLNLPVAKKVVHVTFFHQNEDEILKAKNIQSLFAIIGRYCNYSNYEIIVHIVKRFGDAKLNEKIMMYCDSIKKCETGTTVAVYLHAISALPDSDVCQGFIQMAMKINKPTSVCTMHEIRQLKESIAEKASVYSHCLYMESVAKGSVVVQLRVHPDCSQMVFDAITNNTYQTDVTVVKISDNGTYTYASVTHAANKCESCHQLNLKKSVLEKVVKVLESHKVQEMELAQQ
ncbi:hypothetical protein GBAR_LOCUS21449 [Geodia barretti]|uniref:Uncharacterized protein n=1 Tax=Geodia barretti TaxID=519541 RepID=A0AA35X3J8_GEOBA|nr:hypothetical protein GBAR_LOCUS21449 [Geodia barretti]